MSKPSSSSSVPQKVTTVAAAAGTGSTSEQERKLKQYLEDERIALFLQNEEFMKELQRNREFLIALERGTKTLAHMLNGTISSFWHTPLPLLSQFHLHKYWRVNSYANLHNPAVNADCFSFSPRPLTLSISHSEILLCSVMHILCFYTWTVLTGWSHILTECQMSKTWFSFHNTCFLCCRSIEIRVKEIQIQSFIS